MKIYFVRHGDAAFNSEFDSGDVPLTERGYLQALAIADKLSPVLFDTIICSEMLRTRQTLEPIMRFQKVLPSYDQRLNEVDDFVTGYSSVNNSNESIKKQLERVKSVVENIKNIECENLLILAHFNVIEYISNELGKRIRSPECGECYILEV